MPILQVTSSQREANSSYWNRRRQMFEEDEGLSLARREEGLEHMPQGAANGAIYRAWELTLIERTEDAHDWARFAYQAAESALKREIFWPFFASIAQRDPHLRHLNNLSGQMQCLEIQFAARWIIEGVPPLELLRRALDAWRPSREAKPPWYADSSVLMCCLTAEYFEDALWFAETRLRLRSTKTYTRPPKGETATLALLAEVALGNNDEKARNFSELAVANWCAQSTNWPRNVVGLSVKERVVWFYLWNRHFGSSMPPLNEMLRDLRAEAPNE